MDLENLWQSVLAQIQLDISPANFATWFANTKILSFEDGIISVATPNSFSKEWLEQKYGKDILKILQPLDKNIKAVSFVVDPRKTKKAPGKKIAENDKDSTEQLGFKELEINKETNLNPRYVFDNFIVGPFNELAFAAAMAVVEEPGKNYNPLFVYGGVGLGKTHLVQAIGNKIKEDSPEKKVKYLPAEKLISIIVNSIKKNSIEELKKH